VIVLDTNVVSQTVRSRPSPAVMSWLAAQTDGFAITAVTLGELWTGVQMLPGGRRKEGLANAIETVLERWAVRLPYDDKAARIYADLRVLARSTGRGLNVEDGMIAATCAAHGAPLATRNVADFDFLPVRALNPWTSAGEPIS